jgi:tetratricopeptide (TPR) repeat protein
MGVRRPEVRLALWLALLACLGGGSARAAKPAAPKARPGEAEFRAGWLAYAAPENKSKANATQGLFAGPLRAIPHFDAAVAADPTNVASLTALSYMSYGAAEYGKSKEMIDRAIARERRDPLLYLLRGQVEAAVAQMDPVKAGKNIGKAMEGFDRAAVLDPDNALPLLQGASVALDVDRLDLALPRLKQALARPTCHLYQLPVPTDLLSVQGDALRVWEQLQMGLWGSLLTRGRNVSSVLVRLGLQEEKAGRLEPAREDYLQAMRVARQIGRTAPPLFITVGTALDMLDSAYAGLWRVAKTRQAEAEARGKEDPEVVPWQRQVERWEGEMGILEIGRGELQGAVQAYFKDIGKTPPTSAEALLKVESDHVLRVYRGVGLDGPEPGAEQPPAPKTERPAK